MDEGIEEHGACIAVVSDDDLAQQAATISHTFSPLPDITIYLEGKFVGEGGLAANEVKVCALMTGKHRRRLFDPPGYQPCSGSQMAAIVRDELRRLTGDPTLTLKGLSSGRGEPAVFLSCKS